MIDTKTICMTETDIERLNNLIEQVREQDERAHFPYISILEEKLEFAEAVHSIDIPPNVITMRSKVRLNDLKTGRNTTYVLVFPKEANVDEGKISILAPLASAILGHSLGDEIEFEAPSGLRKLSVKEVIYQPESAGDLDL